MNIKELMIAINEILPGASLEQDLEGQLVLYTGIALDDDGNLIPFDPEEQSNKEYVNWMTDDDFYYNNGEEL